MNQIKDAVSNFGSMCSASIYTTGDNQPTSAETVSLPVRKSDPTSGPDEGQVLMFSEPIAAPEEAEQPLPLQIQHTDPAPVAEELEVTRDVSLSASRSGMIRLQHVEGGLHESENLEEHHDRLDKRLFHNELKKVKDEAIEEINTEWGKLQTEPDPVQQQGAPDPSALFSSFSPSNKYFPPTVHFLLRR